MTEVHKPEKELGRLIMSGHCGFPETDHPENSHSRCQRNGGGATSRATGLFHPCPCRCHLREEDFECGCGYLIREAPALGLDEDGDPRYVHIDEAGYIYSVTCP